MLIPPVLPQPPSRDPTWPLQHKRLRLIIKDKRPTIAS